MSAFLDFGRDFIVIDICSLFVKLYPILLYSETSYDATKFVAEPSFNNLH